LMGKWSATEQERHETECVNNGKCLIGNWLLDSTDIAIFYFIKWFYLLLINIKCNKNRQKSKIKKKHFWWKWTWVQRHVWTEGM
jgi:hypothetical protein